MNEQTRPLILIGVGLIFAIFGPIAGAPVIDMTEISATKGYAECTPGLIPVAGLFPLLYFLGVLLIGITLIGFGARSTLQTNQPLRMAATAVMVLIAVAPTGLLLAQSDSGNTLTISSGQTSASVNHGLSSEPALVLVTPKDEQGVSHWVTKDASQITVSIPTSQASDAEFDWYAQESASSDGSASGTATIPSGSTSTSDAHGLGSEPSIALASPQEEEGATFWVGKDATNVTITIPSTQTIDVNYDWQAGPLDPDEFSETDEGSVTVSSGNTSGNTSHDLGDAPDVTLMSPEDEAGAAFWATDSGSAVSANLTSSQGTDTSYLYQVLKTDPC